MKPFWTTFYSYKGGVGRSLALANTAALLVRRGRRVVLINFDLEAPGLDSFEEFKSVAGKPGVVEYVSEFKETNRAPDITRFVHACELPGPLRGQLFIMPAGKKDAFYNACRARLSWADLYENHHGEQFVENWKAAIDNHYHPDYVFVDSRTGLTDVGGICTLHLPDLVVMFFGLNEQNVKGVAAVAKTIRESDYNRLPQLHYVASPVPNLPRNAGTPLYDRWIAAVQQMGTKIKTSVRYHHIAALGEKLFVLDPDLASSTLVEDYEDLLGSLIDYNRNGLDFRIKQAREALGQGDTDLKRRLLAALERDFPDAADALVGRAQLMKALGDTSGAVAVARQALTADPSHEDGLGWLLETYRRGGDYVSGLSLCESALASANLLSPHARYTLHSERAQMAMAAKNYAAASESYSECVDSLRARQHGADSDLGVLALNMFHACEARRRLGREQSGKWQPILMLFDVSGDASAEPLVLQATRWQAMHIAFAMVGDISRARDALIKARLAAELLGFAEDIFTVKTYTNVPVNDFLAINNEMLAALNKGQLWDGMPLATAEKPEVSQPASQ